MSTVTVGKSAPSFELRSMEGGTYSLPSLLSQGPVLAAFFKVSCPTCQYTFPFLERLYRQLGGNGAQVVGISQDSARDSQAFARQFGVTFPVLIDGESYAVSRKYGVEFVPTLFLIAPDGQVEVSGDGFSRSDLVAIQRSLARRLSVRPPPLFPPEEKVPEYKPG
jgi:peroxiredoxin